MRKCCTITTSCRLLATWLLLMSVLSVFFVRQVIAQPIAKGCDKFLGNISNGRPSGNFGNYWNQVTLENAGKWAYVEPNRDRMNWGPVEAAYNYCREKGIPYKHHTFVWGNQAPGWINSLPPQQQREEVEELIREFGQRFPETEFIDVVNESREKSPSWKEALGGAGETGYDWIVWSFEKAREYCPNSKLLINEYYCEKSLELVTEYLKIINVLKERDLIDGIGIQSHDGETKEGYEKGVLKQCLDSLATAGIPLYSSEFDMAGNDQAQLDFYKNIFPVFWEHPAVHGVTIWGWTSSWLPARVGDGRLIVNGRERPALQWLKEYVPQHPETIPSTRLDGNTMHIAPANRSVLYSAENGGYTITTGFSGSGPVSYNVFSLLGRQLFSGSTADGVIALSGYPVEHTPVVVRMRQGGQSGICRIVPVR